MKIEDAMRTAAVGILQIANATERIQRRQRRIRELLRQFNVESPESQRPQVAEVAGVWLNVLRVAREGGYAPSPEIEALAEKMKKVKVSEPRLS